MIDIGTLGGNTSIAVAVNDSGKVGLSDTSSGQYHAFAWTQSGGIVDLGGVWPDSSASAVNNGGDVVGMFGGRVYSSGQSLGLHPGPPRDVLHGRGDRAVEAVPGVPRRESSGRRPSVPTQRPVRPAAAVRRRHSIPSVSLAHQPRVLSASGGSSRWQGRGPSSSTRAGSHVASTERPERG